MFIPKKNKKTLVLALNGVVLYIDIHNAIKSQIPNIEKTFPKSRNSKILCHHILSDKVILSRYLEKIPSKIPKTNIIVVLTIFLENVKVLSSSLTCFKKIIIFISLYYKI